MITALKTVVQRNPSAFLQDFAGASALVVMLLVALYLPGAV